MIFLLLFFNVVYANTFFSYGMNSEQIVPPGYNVMYGPISLSLDIIFFNNSYNQIYIHSDGYITLSNGSDCGLVEYPHKDSIAIVPYWSPIDTTHNGVISFREIIHRYKLAYFSKKVQQTFKKYQNFTATFGFIVTWFDVPRYNSSQEERNTFQVVFLSNDASSFVLFNYYEMQWTRFVYSYDTSVIKDHNQVHYSIYNEVKNLQKQSNINLTGLWIFRVDGKFSAIKFKNIRNSAYFLKFSLFNIILCMLLNKV